MSKSLGEIHNFMLKLETEVCYICVSKNGKL